MESPWLLPYLAVKLVVYVAWCRVGYAWLPERPRAEHAAAFGVLRFAIGAMVGTGIWVGSTVVWVFLARELGVESEVLTYVLVYVPVRMLEWGIVGVLAYGRPPRGWIVGGVVVSVLADVPMVWSLGWHLPLGRFLC